MTHLAKSIAVADKVAKLVEGGLAGLDRTIADWPAEFRSIIWETVAHMASRRAETAKMENKK